MSCCFLCGHALFDDSDCSSARRDQTMAIRITRRHEKTREDTRRLDTPVAEPKSLKQAPKRVRSVPDAATSISEHAVAGWHSFGANHHLTPQSTTSVDEATGGRPGNSSIVVDRSADPTVPVMCLFRPREAAAADERSRTSAIKARNDRSAISKAIHFAASRSQRRALSISIRAASPLPSPSRQFSSPARALPLARYRPLDAPQTAIGEGTSERGENTPKRSKSNPSAGENK